MKSFSSRASMLFFIIAAGWPMAAPAQFTWLWQNPWPQGNYLHAVNVLGPQTTVAVGDFGTIIRTTDGGNTWALQSTWLNASLQGVSFVDSNVGTVVGDWGVILRTTDGGLNWTIQDAGT